jgi:pyridoxal phosphate phosphatase PHOSPHO2
MEKPHLFIFDFDETLSVRASCYPIEELAPNKEKLNLDDIDYRYEKVHRCWNRRMNEVHERLAEQGIHTKQLIEAFRTIELSPGTEELFRDINANNHKIVIMSNACDLAIEECLRAQNLFKYIDKIESNPVRQTDPIIIIDEYENPLNNKCTICDPNLCKGSVIDQYHDRSLYDKIIFVGDGDNDVCAALHLNKTDFVFAKYDETSGKIYKMYDLLKNQYFEKLKTELFVWKTMKDVHEILKKKNIL